MKRILQFVLQFLPCISFGQSFLPMDTLKGYPAEIRAKVNGEIQSVIQVDFTGDSIGDYIIRTVMDKEGRITETWLSSNFLLFNRDVKQLQDIDFIRFINLDQDPEPEVYSATGYEDGINYALYDLNMKTGKPELLFYFTPIIIADDVEYWGYPWDTNGFMHQTEDGVIRFYCSIDHAITRDGEIKHPSDQTLLPVLFLTGHSTQSDITFGEIRNRTWYTLYELKNAVQGKN